MRLVSIRSPHQSKGRRRRTRPHPDNHQFQSAPLTKARGDIFKAVGMRPNTSFNPLPSPKQGETDGWCTPRQPYITFQSAPLTKARGDCSRVRAQIPPRCFNPLPSPKQGETQETVQVARRVGVSIRSPHQSKGRPSTCTIPTRAPTFQSAPLTKARGDHVLDRHPPQVGGFNPLPSPKQGETPNRAVFRDEYAVFQSAPLTKARGDSGSGCGPRGPRRFNPLPSPKQGETGLLEIGPGTVGGVSIRSPHQSKGRRT